MTLVSLDSAWKNKTWMRKTSHATWQTMQSRNKWTTRMTSTGVKCHCLTCGCSWKWRGARMRLNACGTRSTTWSSSHLRVCRTLLLMIGTASSVRGRMFCLMRISRCGWSRSIPVRLWVLLVKLIGRLRHLWLTIFWILSCLKIGIGMGLNLALISWMKIEWVSLRLYMMSKISMKIKLRKAGGVKAGSDLIIVT